MKIRLRIFLLFAILHSSLSSFALVASQDTFPEIGKPVPDFTLENIRNCRKNSMNASDFKGRYVILDFWNKGCVSCVQSFPKLNQAHQKYKDKLDIILVGTDEDGIEIMFGRFRDNLKLEFPFAFNMPLYKRFVPSGAPHLVWINDKGIVKAISTGADFNGNNIEAFLNNEPFDFTDWSHRFFSEQEVNRYNPEKPFLVNGNGGDESRFSYRSLITEYIPGSPKIDWPDVSLFNKDRPYLGFRDGDRTIFETCTNLKELYLTAYTGYYQWNYGDSLYNDFQGRILFELPDTSLFNADFKEGTGLYWYSLVIPTRKATPSYIMESMRNDLYRYFGYSARIETRKFSYLKVVVSGNVERLKTKGGKRKMFVDYSMIKATNISIEDLFALFFTFHNYWEDETPVIINKTGISANIDVDMKVRIADWTDVQRALKELGFSLVTDEKEFKVLAISEK